MLLHSKLAGLTGALLLLRHPTLLCPSRQGAMMAPLCSFVCDLSHTTFCIRLRFNGLPSARSRPECGGRAAISALAGRMIRVWRELSCLGTCLQQAGGTGP